MTDTLDTSRAALEALAERNERTKFIVSPHDAADLLADNAATLRALAAEREVSSSDPSGDAQTQGAHGVGGESLAAQSDWRSAVEGNDAWLRERTASRAEPPADVAALVEEARRWEAALTARADRIGEGLKRPGVVDRFEEEGHHQELATSAHLIDRLAATLTAQAERIAEQDKALDPLYFRRLLEERKAALARAEKAEALLREAGEVLEPFAVFAASYDRLGMGDGHMLDEAVAVDTNARGLHVRDLRAARAVAQALNKEAAFLLGEMADTIEWLCAFANKQSEWDGDDEPLLSEAKAARAIAAKLGEG